MKEMIWKNTLTKFKYPEMKKYDFEKSPNLNIYFIILSLCFYLINF